MTKRNLILALVVAVAAIGVVYATQQPAPVAEPLSEYSPPVPLVTASVRTVLLTASGDWV